MTRVLITGASGFIGKRLTDALLRVGRLRNQDGALVPIRSLCLVDRDPPIAPTSQDIEIETVGGDLADIGLVHRLAERRWDSMFHLAASLTLDAERDAAKAYAVNVDALRQLMEKAANCPRVVFASSIAVFGGALPDVVDDNVHPRPQTTYGTHKAIMELLIDDNSRKGRIDGRSLRLPIVLTRPGAPSPTVSDQIASIIREPLAGLRVGVPLKPETVIPVASVGAVVNALIKLHDLPTEELLQNRAMNLPSLSVSIGEMIQSVAERLDGLAEALFKIAPDPQLQAIVDGWPRNFRSQAASSLGLFADDRFDAVVQDHLEHVAKVSP